MMVWHMKCPECMTSLEDFGYMKECPRCHFTTYFNAPRSRLVWTSEDLDQEF